MTLINEPKDRETFLYINKLACNVFKIIACGIYNNEIIVNLLCFYTFDMHVLVNKVYEKILNLVVNICLNTAYILIYVGFFKLLT